MIKYDLNLRNLESHLNKIFDIDLYRSIRITECPHCRSENIIKFGYYKNVQRYRCKECGKTFLKEERVSAGRFFAKISHRYYTGIIQMLF